MAFYRTFIQQLQYDGTDYTKGSIVDIFDEFAMGVEKFPFKESPEVKDVAHREWLDEHGRESYISPDGLFLKDYDLDVDVICYGSLSDLHTRIENFLKFIKGENTNGSARLAIYDEHVGQGRKDVIYAGNENTLWYNEDCDDDRIARFTIKFHVDDPYTKVTPAFNVQTGNIATLNWT